MSEFWEGGYIEKPKHQTIIQLKSNEKETVPYAKLDFLYEVDFKNCSAYRFVQKDNTVRNFSLSDEYHKIVDYKDVIDSRGNINRFITIA